MQDQYAHFEVYNTWNKGIKWNIPCNPNIELIGFFVLFSQSNISSFRSDLVMDRGRLKCIVFTQLTQQACLEYDKRKMRGKVHT